MATVSLRGSVWTTASGAKTTASFTPANGELLVAIVGVAGTDTAPTMSDSKGGAWTLVDSFRSHGSAITGGLRMYCRNTAVDGTSMTVTSTPSGDTGNGLVVLSVTDPAAFAGSAIRGNGGQADQAAGTPAPVLDVAALTKNPVIAAVMTQTNGSANCAPRSSPAYTEHFDAGFNTPASGLEVQSVNSGETASTITLGAATPSGFAAIAIEIVTIARVDLTNAAETDTAQALVAIKRVALVPATESDAAVAISFTQGGGAQHVTLVPATEADTAQGLTAHKSVTVTPSTESDAAQAVQATKRFSLTPASESDAAVALDIAGSAQHKTLIPATEADATVALIVRKRAAISPAVEANAAQALRVSHIRSLTAATEVDSARVLSIAKRRSVIPATTADTARPLTVVKMVARIWASETDVARAITAFKRATLTRAVETDVAVTLSLVTSGYDLVPATEVDAAQVLNHTIIGAVREALGGVQAHGAHGGSGGDEGTGSTSGAGG